jgi:hypothetical protein
LACGGAESGRGLKNARGSDAFGGHHHLAETFHDPFGDRDNCGRFFFFFRARTFSSRVEPQPRTQ